MSVSLDKIRRLDVSKVDRDSENTEYEIKLECLDRSKGLFDFLGAVELALDANPRYFVDPIQTASQMTSHFLVDASNEYSVFRYDGKVMLKIKRHDILKGRAFPIFKNSEHFVYDLAQITQQLAKKQIVYVGSMIKRRVKDFLIDNEDDRVYSLAITICESGDQRQFQLEVEYFGSMRESGKPRAKTEAELLNRLTEICAYICQACPNQFSPSVERKYEFVVKNGAVAQKEAGQRKAYLLKNLESI
jgi:hypothetical protein